MATVLVGSIYKHRTFCYSGNQTGLNTRYFQVQSVTGTPVIESVFVSNLDLILSALYLPCLFNGAQYIGSDIQNITGPRPYPIQVGTSINTAIGTGGGLPMASQVSGIYGARTALVGRSYRGRQYIPFPPSAASNVGPPPTMSNAYRALLQLIANQTVGPTSDTIVGTTYGLVWGLVHSSPALIKGTFTPTTTSFVGIGWATQRRRGDFGRTNLLPNP